MRAGSGGAAVNGRGAVDETMLVRLRWSSRRCCSAPAMELTETLIVRLPPADPGGQGAGNERDAACCGRGQAGQKRGPRQAVGIAADGGVLVARCVPGAVLGQSPASSQRFHRLYYQPSVPGSPRRLAHTAQSRRHLQPRPHPLLRTTPPRLSPPPRPTPPCPAGDRERSMGREPNRIFDRTKASAPEALAGYCEVITLPILHALSQLFPSSATSSLLRGALHSFVIWSREQHVALCADLARPAPTRSPSDHTMKIPGTARATAGDSEAPRSQAAPASPRTRQSDKGRGVRASRDAEIARGPASKTGHGDAADPREPDPGSQTDGAQAGPTRRRNPSLGIEPPRDGKEGRVKGWVRKSVPGGTGGNGGVARGAKGPENGSNRSWRLDVARGLVRVGEQFQRVVGQFGPSVGLVGMNLDPPQEAVDIVKAAAEGSKGGSSKVRRWDRGAGVRELALRVESCSLGIPKGTLHAREKGVALPAWLSLHLCTAHVHHGPHRLLMCIV